MLVSLRSMPVARSTTGRKTQRKAVAATMAATVRSPRDMGPSAASWSAIICAWPGTAGMRKGKAMRVSTSQVSGSMMATVGTPTSIHSPKLTVMP